MGIPRVLRASREAVLHLGHALGQQEMEDMLMKQASTIAALEAKLDATTASGEAGDVMAAMTHMWLILCGALVMFMHAGFAMLEAGCCRAGFTQSVSQPLSGLRYTGDPRPGVCRWFSRSVHPRFKTSCTEY